MLTGEELATRRSEVAEAPDLSAALAALQSRVSRLLVEPPPLAERKALLSTDGGVCGDDGAALVFDPWSPSQHRCPQCQRTWTGDRHDRAWARWQHLWVAERTADLAVLAALTDDDRAAARATELLSWYADRYGDFPNVDNVLGPAHVFFSTYLESIWLDNLMAAAMMLGESGRLDASLNDAVSRLADTAAAVIGEYDEGASNRQTWNNAALLSIAVWFEDEGLAHRCIEGPTGVISHLLHGFGADGLWYEGENYHFFALQGLLRGAGWARLAGVDLFQEQDLVQPIHHALLAPRVTALPDLTHPARKDARFGVSLTQPMFLESWEIGLGRSTRSPNGPPPGLASWLDSLYRTTPAEAQQFDSYLHEIGQVAPDRRSRSQLSWRALMEMVPELTLEDEPSPDSTSVFVESHGLAVLRTPERYVSLECGSNSSGHGHPDRLHLTVHAGDVHWLPDPGTGSYVAADLHYYRATIAHNAPLLQGRSQTHGRAHCEAFDHRDAWGWIRGSYEGVRRTVVAGPGHLIDVIDSGAEDERLLEIPWHVPGTIRVVTEGAWHEQPLDHPGTESWRRFEPATPGAIVVRAEEGERVLHMTVVGPCQLWEGSAPGLPPAGVRTSFLLMRATARHLRCVTLLDWEGPSRLDVDGDLITVTGERGATRHQPVTAVDGEGEGGVIRLGGLRAPPAEYQPLVLRDRPLVAHAQALPLSDRALGEEAALVDSDAALHLDHEDQYRRAEDPYPGPQAFAAYATPAWDHEGLSLAVRVTKEDVRFRSPDEPPLHLDNDPDDIHGDGVQVYLSPPGGAGLFGAVVVPDPDGTGIHVRVVSGEGTIRGTWRSTATGYALDLVVTPGWWDSVADGDTIGFDLLVNEARPGRLRRAGQLVWSGRGGWVWLRGDRQAAEHLGVLDLAAP